jgi:hypothetical protein
MISVMFRAAVDTKLRREYPLVLPIQTNRLMQNIRLDMDLPIIDILCQARAANQLPTTMNLYDREQWINDVELYAPGYLALEAEGRAGEYPLHRLIVPGSVERVRKQVLNRV